MKKFIALLCTLCMIATMVPFAVMAETATTDNVISSSSWDGSSAPKQAENGILFVNATTQEYCNNNLGGKSDDDYYMEFTTMTDGNYPFFHGAPASTTAYRTFSFNVYGKAFSHAFARFSSSDVPAVTKTLTSYLLDDAWNNIFMVLDNAEKTVTTYVNNVLVGAVNLYDVLPSYGKVSEDKATYLSDKDSKTYTISLDGLRMRFVSLGDRETSYTWRVDDFCRMDTNVKLEPTAYANLTVDSNAIVSGNDIFIKNDAETVSMDADGAKILVKQDDAWTETSTVSLGDVVTVVTSTPYGNIYKSYTVSEYVPVVVDLGARHGHANESATAAAKFFDTDVTGMTELSLDGGTTGTGVFWGLSENNTVLTIKANKETDMPAVTESGSAASLYTTVYGWRDHNSTITKVIVCEGITSIGARAFESMDNLAEVVLPSTLREIKQYAFNGVKKLTSIEIPEGTRTLAKNWISNCSAISTIKLPTTITSMDFPDGRKVSDSGYPRGAQKAEWIVYNGTYAYDRLKNNNINNGWADYAINFGLNPFKTMATLTVLEAPAKFKGVLKTYSTQPSDLASAEKYATAEGMPWTIDVATKTLTFKMTKTHEKNGVKYGTHNGMNALWEGDWYRLYNSYIENIAFDNSEGLGSVELPRQLLSYLTNVETLTIPYYVTGARWALCHSAGYKKVILEDGVTGLGDNYFYNCKQLTEVRLPNTLTSITDRSFNGCTALKELYLPAGVTSISVSGGNAAKDAFANCTITLKYYTNTKTAAAIETYKSSTKMTTISYETLNKAEGYLKDTAGVENAFKWVLDTDTKSLVVSKDDEVESNGKIQTFTDHVPGQPLELLAPWHYFGTAGTIDNVVIGEGIKHIPSQILRENGVYATVTLPSTLTSASSMVFNAAKISELYIKEGANFAGENMINDNSDVEKIIFPSTMTPAQNIIRDFTFGSRKGMSTKDIILVAPYASHAYAWAEARKAEATAAGDGYVGMPAENITILPSYEITGNSEGAVTVANNTGYAVDSAYVIVAYYDDAELSSLSAAKLSDVQTLASESNAVNVETYADAEGKTVRVFLWNNLDDLKPMAAVFGE